MFSVLSNRIIFDGKSGGFLNQLLPVDVLFGKSAPGANDLCIYTEQTLNECKAWTL